MGMGQTNSLVVLGDGPERLLNQAMAWSPLPGSAHLPEDLNCGLDWILQSPFVHVIPSTQTSQTEEDGRAKYNTSKMPNRLPVVVIVLTEIIAPGGIVAPG
jgi:hypothetical protein